MAERRMRLKRGKPGDTGVVLPSALPVDTPREPSAFDEDLVKEITSMSGVYDTYNLDAVECVQKAVRLTMATMAMKQNLATPPRSGPPATSRPHTVTAVNVAIHAPEFTEHSTIFGQSQRVVSRAGSIFITVEGTGDPQAMLREASIRIYDPDWATQVLYRNAT